MVGKFLSLPSKLILWPHGISIGSMLLIFHVIICQILTELTELCKSKDKDCAHEQRLLKNMKSHEVVLDLLQIPYNQKVHMSIISNMYM